MKAKIKSVIVSAILIGFINSASATEIWTADIDNIYAYADGRAKIFLTNLTEGPSGKSDAGCTTNAIWLSQSTTLSATPSALSIAMLMYTRKDKIRIAFNGQDADCVLINLGKR